MELFFNKPLSEEVITTIATADKAQMGFHTDNEDVSTIVESAKARVLNGTLVLAYHKHCVFFLTDYLPGVLLLDSIRGKDASIFDYVKGIKLLIENIKNTTKIHKLITRTPYKDLLKLQKKIGFTLEGTHIEEYLLKDGSYTDMYTFGYIFRRD